MSFSRMLLLFFTITLCSSFSPNGAKNALTEATAWEQPEFAIPSPALLPSEARFTISENAYRHALKGYMELLDRQLIRPGGRLAIIDFSLPSDRERLVVIDMGSRQVLHQSLVAHGRNSGELMATRFSNTPESYQSSLGFYRTAETYYGKHGYSLRLDGLESGFNDNARSRAVVMHGADYASREFIDQYGRLGRSLGCPSVPAATSRDIINSIKEDQLLFIYADQPAYLEASELL